MRAIWEHPKRENQYTQHTGPKGRIILTERSRNTTSTMVTFNSEREAKDSGWIKISEEVKYAYKEIGSSEGQSDGLTISPLLG